MLRQSENFIELIDSYLEGRDAQLVDADWNKIFETAAIHNLTGMVYLCVKNKQICQDPKIIKRFEANFMATVKYSICQEVTMLSLIDILNKNKIRHILFKGFILKDYYPDKELRTMGDIDIVIDNENQDRVHELLLDSGFEYDELNSKPTVRNYGKNGMCFEIHTKIVGKNIFESIDSVGYFEDNFKYAKLIKDYSYEFNYEHHLIYMLTHMATHFKVSGCGVRMVLDAAVFIKYLSEQLDWSYIEKELDYLGLLDFSKNIFALCGKWFNTNVPIGSNIKDLNDLTVIEEYIMAGGVFGYDNKNPDAIRFDTGSDSRISRVLNLIKVIFPSYEKLKSRYVWFEGTPKWLLPIGWLRFWWFRLVVNKENSFKRIKLALESNEDASEHTKLMRLVGLNRN